LFYIGNNQTDYFQSYSHLGHTINASLTNDDDVLNTPDLMTRLIMHSAISKILFQVKIYLLYIVPDFLDVDLGLFLMKKSTIRVLHGGKQVAECGIYLINLTAFCYCCWMTVYLRSTKFADLL
jgi:hypothetical protein